MRRLDVDVDVGKYMCKVLFSGRNKSASVNLYPNVMPDYGRNIVSKHRRCSSTTRRQLSCWNANALEINRVWKSIQFTCRQVKVAVSWQHVAAIPEASLLQSALSLGDEVMYKSDADTVAVTECFMFCLCISYHVNTQTSILAQEHVRLFHELSE